MGLSNLNGRYFPSDNFRLLPGNGAQYFINRKGKKVLTDKWGQLIWECLPNTAVEVLRQVRAHGEISERLVNEYLAVFFAAGIIENKLQPTPEVKKADAPPAENNALISVIVITYNGEKFIKRCFNSLKVQTYKNLELIAVDNASQDNSVGLLLKHFPEVQVLALKKNLHYAGGINAGISRANGEYIFLLNQDTELDPDCISQLYKKVTSNPKIGAVAPMMKFADLPGFINGLGNQIHNHSWGTDSYIYCVDVGQFEDLAEVPSACFGAVLLTRKALVEVGPVDEGYKSFYEDSDWSFRCWLHGWKIVPAGRALVYHDFGASYPDKQKLALVIRNRLRLVFKIFQGRIRLGFLKNYIREDIRNFLSLLRRRHFNRALCYPRAYIFLAVSLPGIWLKRRKLMRSKVKTMRERMVLEKNPSFYCCLHAGLDMPEIDVATIRRYYRWALLKRR